MFCPRCGAENNAEQKYCRQCGQLLAAARLALEGRVSEAAELLRKGESAVQGGVTTLGIFILIAIISALLTGPTASIFTEVSDVGGGKFYLINWVANLILGLLFGLPGIVIGLTRLKRANRILQGQIEPPAGRSTQPQLQAPPAAMTDRSLAESPAPASVTEHTTYELTPPDPRRKSQSER